MTVYAIHALETDFVKVGWTNGLDVSPRQRGLQQTNPSKLVLLAQINHASTSVEKQIHLRLGPWSVRGEWFRLDTQQRLKLVLLFQTWPGLGPVFENPFDELAKRAERRHILNRAREADRSVEQRAREQLAASVETELEKKRDQPAAPAATFVSNAERYRAEARAGVAMRLAGKTAAKSS